MITQILHPTRHENKYYRRQAGDHSGLLVELKIELKVGFRIQGPKKLRRIANVFILLSACFRLARPWRKTVFQRLNGSELPHGIRLVRSRADAGTCLLRAFCRQRRHDCSARQNSSRVRRYGEANGLASVRKSLLRNLTTYLREHPSLTPKLLALEALALISPLHRL